MNIIGNSQVAIKQIKFSLFNKKEKSMLITMNKLKEYTWKLC